MNYCEKIEKLRETRLKEIKDNNFKSELARQDHLNDMVRNSESLYEKMKEFDGVNVSGVGELSVEVRFDVNRYCVCLCKNVCPERLSENVFHVRKHPVIYAWWDGYYFYAPATITGTCPYYSNNKSTLEDIMDDIVFEVSKL